MLEVGEVVDTMMPHHEAYEHLGEVKALVQDMHPVWEKKTRRRCDELPARPNLGQV
jgi:hypothetical protein